MLLLLRLIGLLISGIDLSSLPEKWFDLLYMYLCLRMCIFVFSYSIFCTCVFSKKFLVTMCDCHSRLKAYWLIDWFIYCAPCGAGAPLFPLVHLLPHFSPFYFFLSFIGFTYFLLLSIHSLSTRIVPLRFQAGGRRRRLNLGLVCVLFCTLCYLYSLVKIYCGALFYLV